MRYTIIAQRNDATRMTYGETALEQATLVGLTVYTSTWQDSYTNAYGRTFAVRTKHLKKLPSNLRKIVKGGV